MIKPDGTLECDSCHKEILLKVVLQEGSITFYCPRCHYYQQIQASTAQVSDEGLTKGKICDSFLYGRKIIT